MKRVIIGMENGKPYIVNCPKNVEVVFKFTKKKTLKKRLKTIWYKIGSIVKGR